jgi:hypothetical protein
LIARGNSYALDRSIGKNADNAALEKRLCNAAMRDNASNPAKPNAADGKQPTTI